MSNEPNALLRGGPSGEVIGAQTLWAVADSASELKIDQGNCYDHFRRHH